MFRKTKANYQEDGEEIVGPEEATPWSEMKQPVEGKWSSECLLRFHHESLRPILLLGHRNVEDMSDDDDEGVYIRSADRQRILKQRDESYRKFLIEESKRVEAKWDSFEEEEEEADGKPKAKKGKKKKKSPEDRKRKAVDDDVEQEEDRDEPDEDDKDEPNEDGIDDQEEVVEPPEKVPKFKAAKTEAVPPPPKKKLKKKRARSQGKNTRDKVQESNPRDSTESSGIASPTTAVTDPSLFINTEMMCLGCREKGHRLKNCPKFKSTVCIKCGSSEHKYLNCPTGGKDFKFATCFVCKETVSGLIGPLTINLLTIALVFRDISRSNAPRMPTGSFPMEATVGTARVWTTWPRTAG